MPELSEHPVQLAAIPYRVVGETVEVMLVTSRDAKRWIVPKGWPMPGKKDHKAAAQEALEEAGVEGKIRKKPVGSYQAWKRLAAHFLMVEVKVYALPVAKELPDWKERSQRTRMWVPADGAAALVDEPGLSHLLADLPALIKQG
jgi:8-oxo-dGTP pyrophosphatase MutT (NUDIX family)